jgi:hypothetical protein
MNSVSDIQLARFLLQVQRVDAAEKARILNFNIERLNAFTQTLDPAQLPGPSIRGTGNPLFNETDANILRAHLDIAHRDTDRWIDGTFDDWEVFQEPQETAPLVQTPAVRAATLFQIERDLFIYMESFHFRVFPNDANFHSLSMQHSAGLQMENNKRPELLYATFINWQYFFRSWKSYQRRGGTASLIDCIHEAALNNIHILLQQKFPDDFAKFQNTAVQQIPEPCLLGFIFLLFSSVSESDRKSITNLIESLKMAPFTSFFDMEQFQIFMTKFLMNKSIYEPFLPAFNDKAWANLLFDGLSGTDIRAHAKQKAALVGSTYHFNKFLEELNQFAELLNQAALPLQSAFSAGRKAAAATNDQFKKSSYPRANASQTADSSERLAPKLMSAGQECFNCKSADHKVWKCLAPCKLSLCSDTKNAHAGRYCPCLKTNFDQLLRVTHSDKYLAQIPTNIAPSCSTPLVGRTLSSFEGPIQYDSGANALISPKAPVNSIVIPATPEDSIILADGSTIVVKGKTVIGKRECLIIPQFPSTLVPQSTIEDSNSVSVLINKKLLIYDTRSTPKLIDAIYSTKPYVSVDSSNGLYYFSQNDFQAILDKTNYSTEKSNPIQKKSTSIAVYHTIKFDKISDVILFWHENLGHINKEKMISIVENKLIDNLPLELSVPNILKFFPDTCLKCSIGNLQALQHPFPKLFNPNVPIGAWWSVDFKKYSGADDEKQVKSLKGFTHFFLAIDYQSGRAFGYPVSDCKNVEIHLQALYDFNLRKNYTMYGISMDKQFVTTETTRFLQNPEKNLKFTLLSRKISNGEIEEKYTSSGDTLIIKNIGIPYEHFTLGEVERLNRSMHENVMKKSQINDNVTPQMWALGAEEALDMYNTVPTSRHPNSSPYVLYDKFTLDVRKTPILPYGTMVVAHYPLEHQTIRTGRGFPAVVVGRAPDHTGGIRLLNPRTNREIIRRTFKIMGDNPIKGLLFDSPISIEITPDEHDDILQDDDEMPGFIEEDTESLYDEEEVKTYLNKALHYVPVHQKNISKFNKKFFSKIGLTFAETLNDDNKQITGTFKIVDIVTTLDHPKTFFYKYYDSFLPIPTNDDDFEYSLCTDLINGKWANFNLGRHIANALKKSKKDNMPTSYIEMMRHPDAEGFRAALKIELEGWFRLLAILPNHESIDWDSIDPSDIGDLMLIFDKIYEPDGSFKKYKCRMVFRGDRWKNKLNLPVYASSVDNDSLFLFLGVAATEDLDLWKEDVSTAFLHGRMPTNLRQFVRRPYGVPDDILPKKFELGACVYGHPLASKQWDILANKDLSEFGFKKLYSSPSVMVMKESPTNDRIAVARATDDMLFQAPFNSPMKNKIHTFLESKYGKVTIEDPVINYLGMQFVRNRENRTISVFQPKFLEQMRIKYPMQPTEEYPTTPMHYSKYLSVQDKLDKEILLTKDQITELQGVIGDSLWIAMHTKPIVKFALNVISRKVSPNPTVYDLKQALRIIHYCIGTAHVPRIIGGLYGPILTATVDSSFASHDDFTGQSSFTIHMGGGGAVIVDSKKQTEIPSSSTASEIVGNFLFDKANRWSRNFLEEFGYDQNILQPDGTPTGEDNTSTMKILNNESNIGKTKFINLKFNIIKESLANKLMKTENMPADIGTKSLPPGTFQHLSEYVMGHKHLPHFKQFFTTLVDLPAC